MLHQVIDDALATVVTLNANGNCTPTHTDQIAARRFLFDRSGPWAKARARVCALAEIDEAALLDRLKGEEG